MVQLRAKLGPSWRQVGPSWSQVGAKLEPTWANLGQVGTKLGPSRAKNATQESIQGKLSRKLKKSQKWHTYHTFGGLEGSSWSQVEAMLGQVGPNLRPCWDKLAKSGAKYGPKRPTENRQKIDRNQKSISVDFWGVGGVKLEPN